MSEGKRTLGASEDIRMGAGDPTMSVLFDGGAGSLSSSKRCGSFLHSARKCIMSGEGAPVGSSTCGR